MIYFRGPFDLQIRSLREDKNISSLQSHEANPGNDEVQCTQQGRWCEADSLQKEGSVNPNEESLEVNKELTPEVLKEVKNLKRQNHITHAILGIMVVSSLIWRFSELSVALLVKDQLGHPFRAIGSFLFGRFKGSESGNHKHQLLPNMETSTVIQNFEVPHLPHIEIPSVFPTEDKNDHRSNGVMHEIVEFVSQNDSNYQNKS
eukprot:TRINITY_DN3182_c0_g1_i1.p1 TRINITY_DN3182_c0_g1~~TRINITY_DN3182_c0_g1_i1.p1  ORF type:complete len:203 (-),score=31.27 TRINITY_DN3182_c0_g1_i1:247-855(-)